MNADFIWGLIIGFVVGASTILGIIMWLGSFWKSG